MNILLINGASTFSTSNGELNRTLHTTAVETLLPHHEVKETVIERGYDIAQEVKKFLWADIIVYQMPAWWMGAPWTLKKYIDEVLIAGYGSFYENDGRLRTDPTRQYGTGGLLQGRKYMLSVTWSAPEAAFNEPGNFFEGKGVDAVYFPFHKAQQFIGLDQLPTFMVNDCIKSPDVASVKDGYRMHLQQAILAN